MGGQYKNASRAVLGGEMENLFSEKASSAKELLAQVERAIQDGELQPGTRMLTERRIAELAGLSRATVRSALEMLQQKGLITRSVGRGTFVSIGLVTDRDIISTSEGASHPTPRQFMEFRILTEPHLAEHLVLSASDETLAELSAFVQQSRTANNWRETEYVDAEFHRRLFCATQNPMLISVSRLMDAARQSPAWLMLKQRRFDLRRWERYQAEHEEIVAALQARDSVRAQKLLTGHLTGVSQRFEV